MDDMDRQIIRSQINWNKLRKLGVNKISCDCGEHDPICFDPKNILKKFEGNIARGICANCAAIENAEKSLKSLNKKTAYLGKLGVPNIRCLCGQDNPHCMEADHVDGQQFGDSVYALCCNCHLKRTARQLSEHPGFWLDSDNQFVRILNKVGSTADYLEFAAGHLREIEKELLNLV
jgi:hypothetical protein